MNTSGEMKYSLRNSHSLSLDNYHMDIPETLNVKDRQVLCNRGVTFAGFTPDTSKVLIQETHHRRNLHQEMINLNPKIFVRQNSENSKFLLDNKLTKEYLQDIHKYKDPYDQKKFTISRLLSFENENYARSNSNDIFADSPVNEKNFNCTSTIRGKEWFKTYKKTREDFNESLKTHQKLHRLRESIKQESKDMQEAINQFENCNGKWL